MTFNEFHSALHALGWEQAELCRRLGVTRNMARRWEENGPPQWVGEYLRVMVELDRLHQLLIRPPGSEWLELVAAEGAMSFPAHLEPDPDGGYVVTFRDVPEAITQGDTVDEALEMAANALVLAATFYTESGKPIPKPSKPRKGEKLVDFRLASFRVVRAGEHYEK